jgi:hypothetical protein
MTENKFELQSYWTTKPFFCFMLIFTKEYWNLVSYLTFKNRKYRTRTSNRIVHESKNLINNRTINIFADYGFCVFHLCWPWFRRGKFSFGLIWFIWCCPYIIFAVFWNLTVFPVMFFSFNFFLLETGLIKNLFLRNSRWKSGVQ